MRIETYPKPPYQDAVIYHNNRAIGTINSCKTGDVDIKLNMLGLRRRTKWNKECYGYWALIRKIEA